jgi:hypothetical protein
MSQVLAAAALTMMIGTKLLACDVALPDHVRVPDCKMAAALKAAARRSAALNDLLDRVERTNGLVYITPSPAIGSASRLLGGFSHDVSVAGPYRILRIVVAGKFNDSTMAITGHELRHALEVLELSNACSEAEVEALYDRIGWRTSGRTVETQAAIDAGNAIARELRASKRTGELTDDELPAQADVL